MNPMSLGNAYIQAKVQTSKFIDTPSGVLNVVLRRLVHNNPNFDQKATSSIVQLQLKSRISRESLLKKVQMDDKFKT